MRRFSGHGTALLLYTLLSLLLTWPLAARFMTHVPGDGIDDPALAWNLWWVFERLVRQHNFDIFHVDWMFFPVGVNLAFYTLTPLNGLLSLPLQTAFSLILASNTLLLSSYVLGGYGTYLLVRHLMHGPGPRSEGQSGAIRYRLPAIGAGIIYAFASSKLFYASLGQFNIASSQWIPFVILHVLRTGARRRWRDAALAGLFLTFQAWAELTYASFLLIFIALYFLWLLLARERPRPAQPATKTTDAHPAILPFALIGLVFAVGIAPFLGAMLPDLRAEGNFFASGGGFADVFSADLMGYLVPTRLHPLWGDWVATLPFPNDKGQQVFVGYTALLLAFIGGAALIRERGWRGLFWPLTALFFWWLTLGPQVRIGGQPTAIPGPFALISRLPFFSGNRYPSRYSVMLMLCVAVLAAYGMVEIGNWVWARRPPLPDSLSALIIAVFLLEHLSVPLPLNDFRVPAVYERIAAEPGDFTVLELPTGWRNGARVLGRSDVLIMMQQWYQTVHGKRRLGGNTSRNPPYKFQYFTDAPLLGDLIALMNADAPGPDGNPYIGPVVEEQWDALAARDRAMAPTVLDFLNVRFVILHVEKSPPQLVRFVEEVLPVTLETVWTGKDWTGAPATIRLYRVETTPPAAWTVDLAAPPGRLHLAEGWSSLAVAGRMRYATRRTPELLLDLPETGGTLTLEVFGPARLEGVALNRRSLVWVAGRREGTRQMVEVSVPPGVAAAPVDRLSLRFGPRLYSGLYAEAINRNLPQPIGQTGGSLPPGHGIVAVSAGQDVGDFAHIYVTNRAGVGQDLAPGERGYNLVALDTDGNFLGSAVFDTLASPSASAALAAWIDRWPRGTIVAGAVDDEAGLNLGEDGVAALRSLGVADDVRGRFRWSHAFIGVAGAAPGVASEDRALLRPAVAVVGMPIDSPVITGGVGRIEFKPNP